MAVAAFALAAPLPAAGPLTAGFAAADITPAVGDPKRPVTLAGFGQGRVATRVHDPIFARAVVLDDGTKRIALVSADLVGLFYETAEAVRTKLGREYHYVLVASTHNHDGPDTLGLWGRTPFQSGVDPAYLKRVEDACVTAVRAADRDRVAVTAEFATVHAPELIADNRRPVVKHDELSVIRFTGPDRKPAGLLVNWHAHPETMGSRNTELSSDFVGPAVAALAKSAGCPVAYFSGSVGGLMTSLGVPVKSAAGVELRDGTFAKTERYGELLAGRVTAALANPTAVTLTPFTVRTKQVMVPVANPLYRLAWSVGVLKRTLYLDAGTPTPAKWVAAADLSRPVGLKTEVGYLKLGDVEIAAIPGEIYPELVLGRVATPAEPGADFPDAPAEPHLFATMRGRHRMVFGLANDELGYLIPKRQWDDKPPYCYGLKKPQYGEGNSTGPAAAGVVCAAFAGVVGK